MALTWNYQTTPASATAIQIAWSPTLERFVAAGDNIMFSDDAETWTDCTPADYPGNTNTVAANGLIWSTFALAFIIVTRNNFNTTKVLKSTDGENWTIIDSDTGTDAFRMRAVAEELVTGLLCAVGNDGAVLHSTDAGATWVDPGADLVSLGATTDWIDVIWHPQSALFVAVANLNSIRIATSPDGVSWTGRHGFEVAYQKNWFKLALNPLTGLIISTVSNGNSVMRSMDGITWETPYAMPTPPVTIDLPPTYEGMDLIWSEILDAFAWVFRANSGSAMPPLGNPKTFLAISEEANDATEWDYVEGGDIPVAQTVFGDIFNGWDGLGESTTLDKICIGAELETTEGAIITSSDDPGTITGDQELGIEDHSLFGGPNDMIEPMDLGIALLAPYEIVGDIELGIDLSHTGLIMSADASGLYVLVPNKTNDTIYLRDSEDDVSVEQLDVAIPDPTLATAYVGG